MQDCELCNSIDEDYRVISENDSCFCILNLEPIKEGHVMILPKRHIQSMEEMTEKESKDFFKLADQMIRLIERIYSNKAIIFFNSSGLKTQNHIHAHIVYLKEGLREVLSKSEKTPTRRRAQKNELELVKNFIRNHQEFKTII